MTKLVFTFLLFIASVTVAQDRWTLQSADFKTRNVSLSRVDESSVVGKEGDAEVSVPMTEFLSLTRVGLSARAIGRWRLVLSNGDQLAGEPVSTSGETVVWKSNAFGDVSVSMRQMRLIVPAKTEMLPELPSSQEDAVLLANGDRAGGVIRSIDGSTIQVETGGGPVDVPLDSITSVQFAQVGSGKPNRTQAFRVATIDGSRLSVAGLGTSGNSVSFTMPGGKSQSLDLSAIVSIEQMNGPVIWLSMLTPAESIHTPYFDTRFPAKMDRAVGGGPIRFKDRAFAHGIGVHSYSRLTWKLDDYKGFRTQYAIDGDRPLADVTVRIRSGERVLHEATHVRAGKLADAVIVDVAGLDTLTLEVDYGDNYDVQDHLNFIEPALLRNSPPATAPAH